MTGPDSLHWTSPMESATESLVEQVFRIGRMVRLIQHEPSIVDLSVLTWLDDLGPQDIAGLAALDRRSQSTVGGAVRMLAEQGAVRREQGDRLAITATGKAILADDRRRHTEMTAQRLVAGGRFAPSDVRRAAEVLAALLDEEQADPHALDRNT